MYKPGIRPPLWNVPYQRNPFFTGREETLKHLHTSLQVEKVIALSHPHGITGLGGIGKTQTALEYAYRYRTEYRAVFWVRADSSVALLSSFATLAHLLELPQRNEQDQYLIAEAVLRWLQGNPGWLLIFDNMDTPAIAEPFMPQIGQGHILFTTRAHSFGEIAQRLDIRKMEPETGALLLLRRANILLPKISLDNATLEDRGTALEISQKLDGLPLALDQAGAYIKETPCSLSEYLSRYQIRHQELLQIRGNEIQDYYPATVATTWSLSFEKVYQINPAAAELLNLCAFLAPDAIPEEIFTIGADQLGDVLSPIAANPVQLDLACKDALKFSL